MVRALTERGHTVTVFTPFVDGDRDGYIEVDMSEQMVPIVGANVTYLMEAFGKKRLLLSYTTDITRADCDKIHEHRLMVDIMNGVTERKFDLVITERSCLSAWLT